MKNKRSLIFYISLAVTVILLLWGFVTPPKGVIDGTVLIAAGILFAFATLDAGVKALAEGRNLKMKHKETELEISQNQ